MLNVSGNAAGAVSAYDLKLIDSTGAQLDIAPLRYSRIATTVENIHQGSYNNHYIYRAEVSFTLPADNKVGFTVIAVADGLPAAVVPMDAYYYAPPGRGWMSVTGCAVE